MKKLLTIIAKNSIQAETACNGIEIFYPEENESEKNFALRAAKNADGKYTVIIEQKFALSDIDSLLNILDKNSSDMVIFEGGTAVKTSIVKGTVKECRDIFSCMILSILDCKSLLKSAFTPFSFEKSEAVFTEDNYEGLLIAAKAFIDKKSKLAKEHYVHILNAICSKLVVLYLTAMIAIKEGKIDSQSLISFDGKLKGEIVLYLALEKRFKYAKLIKLRKKGFKISKFTAKRFKRALKAQ